MKKRKYNSTSQPGEATVKHVLPKIMFSLSWLVNVHVLLEVDQGMESYPVSFYCLEHIDIG